MCMQRGAGNSISQNYSPTPRQFSRPVSNTPISYGNYGPTPGGGNIAPVNNNPALCNQRPMQGQSGILGNILGAPSQTQGLGTLANSQNDPAGLKAPIAILELMKAARGGL